MNLKIIEKSLLPLLLATLFIVAFHWQFTHSYAFLIEHFRAEKLSTLYIHLFIYTFLVFTIFLFLMNSFNNFFKSKIFIAIICITLFSFYGFIHEIISDPMQYLINYPLLSDEVMLMVLFIVTTFIYALYTLGSLFFKSFIPFSHSLIFLIIGLLYSAWFIDLYCYPIDTLLNQFNINTIAKNLSTIPMNQREVGYFTNSVMN